jgi:hypothetical protein
LDLCRQATLSSFISDAKLPPNEKADQRPSAASAVAAAIAAAIASTVSTVAVAAAA